MKTQFLESALTPLSIAPDGLTVIDALGNVFAKTNFPVDASKIVECVNHHQTLFITARENARLIASAPELLEALEALLSDYSATLDAYNDYRVSADGMQPIKEDDSAIAARAAINAAKGEV